jgi:flagellar protein FliL
MANDNPTSESPAESVPTKSASSSGISMKKILLVGIPVFLLQAAGIYFLAVKFLAPSPAANAQIAQGGEAEKEETVETALSKEEHVFVVKDLIVNPAGTNGTRFLLTTVGLGVSSQAMLDELTKKEVRVRDVLNSILTGKSLDELVDVKRREDLRAEIAEQISKVLSSGKLRDVYFSKFIIQ